MNTAKVAVKIKVLHSCIIRAPDVKNASTHNESMQTGERLLVPYLIAEIKSQLTDSMAKAVLNRVYYNLRVNRIGYIIYGVPSVSLRELCNIGIYIEERKK